MDTKSTHNSRPDTKRSSSWRSFLRPPSKSPVPSGSSSTTNNTKANNNIVTKAKNNTTPSSSPTTTPSQPHHTPNSSQPTQETAHNQHTEQTHQIWQAQETLRTFVADTWPQHTSSIRIECHVPLSALYPLLSRPPSSNSRDNRPGDPAEEENEKEEKENGLRVCRRLVHVPGPLHEEVARGVWVFLRGLAAEAAAAAAASAASATKAAAEAAEYEKGGSGLGGRREEDKEKAAAAQWGRHVKSFVRVVSPGSTASPGSTTPPDLGGCKTGSKTGLAVPGVKGTVPCPFCGGGCIPPPTPTATNTQVCQGRRGGRWLFQRKEAEGNEVEVEAAADPFWQREEDLTVLSNREEDLEGLLSSQEEGSGVSRGKGRKGVEAFGRFFSSKDSKEAENKGGEESKKKRGEGREKRGERPGLKRGVPHRGK
ncbi:hypothetical protein B0J18DRAFT_436076 [Chaetomium sp. MPI-SDFR-AT-0129]|nr:hypothetical protein B0J18DRAFT_436076 [Chaetomium sp. MPI-SDFR-AT-0129]